ncbi:MAG: DUF4249 family protein [Bacteroidales bacterium]|nr:DUF4249 family protein [Bacteroidales bacterium]
MPISGASVSLFVDDDFKEKLSYGTNGVYTGTYLPKPGDEIKIEVIAGCFDPIRSHTVIPEEPGIVVNDSTVIVREVEHNVPNNNNTVNKTTYRSMQVQLKLTDAANQENYYFIKALKKYYRKPEIETEKILELKLSEVLKKNFIDNGNFLKEIVGDEGKTERVDNLFSDHFVNGKDILFDFSYCDTLESVTYFNSEITDTGNGEEKALTVEYIIEIGEISKDLYQYVISGNKMLNSKDTPFSEPVLIHTNIENGIGILGAYNTYRFVSRFQTNYFPDYFAQ